MRELHAKYMRKLCRILKTYAVHLCRRAISRSPSNDNERSVEVLHPFDLVGLTSDHKCHIVSCCICYPARLAVESVDLCDLSGLTVESVDLCDLAGLVVAAQQGDLVGPLGLQRQQPGQRLQTVVAAVHEVAHEYVVGVRHLVCVCVWGGGDSNRFSALVKDKLCYSLIE